MRRREMYAKLQAEREAQMFIDQRNAESMQEFGGPMDSAKHLAQQGLNIVNKEIPDEQDQADSKDADSEKPGTTAAVLGMTCPKCKKPLGRGAHFHIKACKG